MRLLRDVYEGPASHGILRVAASVRGTHAVLRALPGEGNFQALYAAHERTGEPAPVTLSVMREGSDAPLRPGGLARDLAGVVRRHPEAEAVVLARSEAALLSGEGIPETVLPESSQTGRSPKLVTHAWEAPGMREIEGAELALEDLVRAHAPQGGGKRGGDRTARPTVNLFGPPVFGPGAVAEYDEAERLLGLIGVGVNARVPLGADVADLPRLSRAWASVLLYREIGESATLFLQDEFGVARVTTPMIGGVGTGAALRAVGDLCRLDRNVVRRALWMDLARTARLPWYARLVPPETFRGRRAVVFGDLTYCLGLGSALAREVGLTVAACGTYLTHLERDFLFHANAFAGDAFVEDDPEEVAARIEAVSPDVIVGTYLEAGVADSLGVPLLPLCPPVAERPFTQRPLMGYAGSSVVADALDGALSRPQATAQPESTSVPWTDEALEELAEVPPFLRGRARRLAEVRARELDSTEVTREVFLRSRP